MTKVCDWVPLQAAWSARTLCWGATAGLSSSAVSIHNSMMDRNHRKQVRRYADAEDVHELTFSCYQRHPLLTNELWLSKLAESIRRAKERHRYGLLAYVFMPEHVHLLVFPRQKSTSIPALLKAIKRPFSYRIKQLLLEQSHPLLEDLTVHQRPGVKTFRFWQEGPGYDRNITEMSTLDTVIDYIHSNPVRRGLCQHAID